ncbi:MAG: transglycosylase domain-containing protein, partial [Christensenellales bacterium]
EWASSEEIPDMLKNAFVAIEDVRFYKHSGVDFKRLVSAIINTFRNVNTHGGSTITQQLIKNRVLSSEVSYRRKIQEAFLAIELESQYSKEEILEAYLNAIPLGGINYGVKAAAKDYFGKPLSALTIRECAMLAGITQNPTKFNPRLNYYDSNRDKKTTDDRTDTVLLAMYDAGFITREQYESALEEDVVILETSSASSMYDMPAFVEYAVSEVVTCMLKDRGLEDTGANRAAMEKILRTGGYHIYTTVVPEIQNIVQETLSTWEGYPKIADPTYSVRISKNPDGTVDEIVQPQAAAVVIDQATGRIVAMVGSRDEPTRKKLLNRAVASNMPVGSSLKPLSVFAPALEGGMSPASIIMNFAQPIEGYGGSRGYPTGGLTNQGPVTMRKSVVSSLNVGAARVLFENVTPAASKNYLVSMGMDPDTIFADGPGLALGTSGISMLELTAAFATIADGGVYQSPIAFTVVKDSQGNVVLNSEKFRTTAQIFKKSTAWLMTDMLTDAVQSGTGRKARISGITAAGKTGTNESYRGVVFAGYTGYYTSSVWIGHDNYQHALKNGSTGGEYAAPLWKEYMSKIHEGLPDKAIIDSRPEDLGLVKATVCSVTGLVATDACRADPDHAPVTDWFFAGSVPKASCNAHTLATFCSASGKLATPYCPQDALAQKSLLVVPPDSQLATIEPALMEKHMPEAILGFAGYGDLLSLPATDPRYGQHYCNIHSSYSANLPTADELNYARTILDFADTMLESSSYTLPASVRSEILSLVRRLESAVEEGVNGSLISSLSLELYQKCVDAQRLYYNPGAPTPTSTPEPEPEPVEEEHLYDYDYAVTP